MMVTNLTLNTLVIQYNNTNYIQKNENNNNGGRSINRKENSDRKPTEFP